MTAVLEGQDCLVQDDADREIILQTLREGSAYEVNWEETASDSHYSCKMGEITLAASRLGVTS